MANIKKIMVPYFIAEISSNHNGDLQRCLKFIDEAKKAGFDAVKFQLFKIDQLFAKDVLKKKSFLKDRKKWELPESFLPKIRKRCTQNKIDFGCTPFYLDGVDELKKYVDFFKIASYELLWDDLFEKCISTKKKVIFSTGMSNTQEISSRLNFLKKKKFNNFDVMHCISSYPAKIKNLNLKSITFIRNLIKSKKFKKKISVGWSDHSVNESVIYKSIFQYNAELIEMHVDLDKKGNEHHFGHCWLFKDSKKIIENIRTFNSSVEFLGKKVYDEEKKERNWRTDNIDGLRPLIKIRKFI
jgi:N-acetylneuraminate synthase